MKKIWNVLKLIGISVIMGIGAIFFFIILGVTQLPTWIKSLTIYVFGNTEQKNHRLAQMKRDSENMFRLDVV